MRERVGGQTWRRAFVERRHAWRGQLPAQCTPLYYVLPEAAPDSRSAACLFGWAHRAWSPNQVPWMRVRDSHRNGLRGNEGGGIAPGKGGGEEWLTGRKKQKMEGGVGKPEATRCAKFSPGSVNIGTPLHSTSPDAYIQVHVRQRPPTCTLTSAQGAAYILEPAVATCMCAHSYLYRCEQTHTHMHTQIHAREQ